MHAFNVVTTPDGRRVKQQWTPEAERNALQRIERKHTQEMLAEAVAKGFPADGVVGQYVKDANGNETWKLNHAALAHHPDQEEWQRRIRDEWRSFCSSPKDEYEHAAEEYVEQPSAPQSAGPMTINEPQKKRGPGRPRREEFAST